MLLALPIFSILSISSSVGIYAVEVDVLVLSLSCLPCMCVGDGLGENWSNTPSTSKGL